MSCFCHTPHFWESQLRVRVERSVVVEVAEHINSTQRSQFVVYRLAVTLGDVTWKVCRRFSEVVRLHALLKTKGMVLPRLPRRFCLAPPLAKRFRDKRQAQLEHYIHDVLKLSAQRGGANAALCRFLEVSPCVWEHIRCPLETLDENSRTF